MENTGTARASLAWKIALLAPMAAALLLVLTASRQTNLNAEVRWTTIGNLFVSLGLTLQGLYWLIARKSLAIGITALVVGSALLGFGLNTLLRVLGI